MAESINSDHHDGVDDSGTECSKFTNEELMMKERSHDHQSESNSGSIRPKSWRHFLLNKESGEIDTIFAYGL